MVDAIRRRVPAGRKLHANDTPIPRARPATQAARLWTYLRGYSSAGGGGLGANK